MLTKYFYYFKYILQDPWEMKKIASRQFLVLTYSTSSDGGKKCINNFNQ